MAPRGAGALEPTRTRSRTQAPAYMPPLSEADGLDCGLAIRTTGSRSDSSQGTSMSWVTSQFTPRLTRGSLASAELVPLAQFKGQKVLFAAVRNSRGLAWDSVDSVTSAHLALSRALRPGELFEHPVAETPSKHFPHRIQRQLAPRSVTPRAAASSNPGMQSV